MTKIFLSEELRLMLQRDYLKKEDKWVVCLNEELVLCIMVKRLSSRFSKFEHQKLFWMSTISLS